MHQAALNTTDAFRPGRRRSGFTLVELLVVMGIIVLLLGLLFPVFSRIIGGSNRAAAEQTLGTIETAVEAHRLELGDIPRIPTTYRDQGLGFAVLTKALVGPGPALGGTQVPDPGVPEPERKMGDFVNAPANAADIEIYTAETSSGDTRSRIPTETEPFVIDDGFGEAGSPSQWLGIRPEGRTTGQVAGPYLNTDIDRTGMALRTPDGSPVIYIPARKRIPADLTAPDAYIANGGNSALYNFAEVNPAMFSGGIAAFSFMLGDTDGSGAINGDEVPIKQDYLLLSAGVDGQFGYVDKSSDDAANFRFNPNRQ
ncbi:MAG: type II secretion system protein [Phycisphaerae bacterium]